VYRSPEGNRTLTGRQEQYTTAKNAILTIVYCHLSTLSHRMIVKRRSKIEDHVGPANVAPLWKKHCHQAANCIKSK
jgi:hypothetical protein